MQKRSNIEPKSLFYVSDGTGNNISYFLKNVFYFLKEETLISE